MVAAWIKARKAELLTVVIAMVWMFVLYGPVVISPDRYMFSDQGDGVKNYFTFAYHVRHDSDWIKFEGMNYPYGEHVGYTDGHPFFSLLFGWVPWVQEHPVGFLNLLMLFSIPFTAWVLFKLLRENGVSEFVSVLGALAINWLNPQIFRLEGHLALSYAFVIPMALWLIIRWMKVPTWKNAALYALYSIVIFFIHPYLGIITSMVACAAILYSFLRSKSRMHRIQSLLATSIPLLLYLVFMKLTDTHTDRAPDAKGYLFFSASYETIFVPNHKPFRHLISQIIKVRMQQWEGWAYLGLTAILAILCTLVLRFKQLVALFKQQTYWSVLWVMCLVTALLACGFPFNFEPEWLKKIPFLEQFRSPGRFAWILYYTAGVFAWVLIDLVWNFNYQTHGKKAWVAIIAFSVAVVEGWWPQKVVAERVSNHQNVFREEFLSDNDREHLKALVSNKDQAVLLPLPYFHYGSDYYCWDGSQDSKTKAYTMSFLSGVPLFASSNPRVSLEESRHHLGFFSNASNTKTILLHDWNRSDIYVMEVGPPEKEAERQFYGRTNPWMSLQELRNSEVFYQIIDFEASSDTLLLLDEQGNKVDTAHMYLRLDSNEPRDTRQYEILYELPIGQFDVDTLLATVTLRFDQYNAITSNFVVERVDGDNVTYVSQAAVSNAVDHSSEGALLRLKFPYDPQFKYRFFIKGSDEDHGEYHCQDLCVYPNHLWAILRQGMSPDFRKIPMR